MTDDLEAIDVLARRIIPEWATVLLAGIGPLYDEEQLRSALEASSRGAMRPIWRLLDAVENDPEINRDGDFIVA